MAYHDVVESEQPTQSTEGVLEQNKRYNDQFEPTKHKVYTKRTSLCGFKAVRKRDEFLGEDSGASTHMFPRREHSSHLETTGPQPILLGESRIVTSTERGSVALEVTARNER